MVAFFEYFSDNALCTCPFESAQCWYKSLAEREAGSKLKAKNEELLAQEEADLFARFLFSEWTTYLYLKMLIITEQLREREAGGKETGTAHA